MNTLFMHLLQSESFSKRIPNFPPQISQKTSQINYFLIFNGNPRKIACIHLRCSLSLELKQPSLVFQLFDSRAFNFTASIVSIASCTPLQFIGNHQNEPSKLESTLNKPRRFPCAWKLFFTIIGNNKCLFLKSLSAV